MNLEEAKEEVNEVLDEYEQHLSLKYTSYMTSGNGLELMILAKLKYPGENKYTDMSLSDAIKWAKERIKEYK